MYVNRVGTPSPARFFRFSRISLLPLSSLVGSAPPLTQSSASLPEHNARFAQAPASAEDFHRRAPSRTTLDRVFQLEEDRVLSNDWVVRYDTRYFQVARQSGQAPARSTVVVREASDGAIELRYRGRLMQWTEIAAPVKPTAPAVRTPLSTAPHRPARPSADHPWRRGIRAIDRERALSGAAQP